jgi:hypothetical protein
MNGLGVTPGETAGRYGTPSNYGDRAAYDAGAYNRYGYGTHYEGNDALVAQKNNVYVGAGAGAYPTYNRAMYGGYPGSWAPTNMTSPSLYSNPGYGAVAGNLGMSPQPMPQNYGSNVIAQPQGVYVNGDNVGTPQQYAAQANQLATSGAAQPSADSQWQPLGVFAMADGTQANPAAVIQLAVNRQGMLRGNLHNVTNDAVAPISGAVDPKTQRAAWTVGDQKSPVFEAGIANLTTDQTTMLAHTADGQQKQFTLIRLPDPSQSGGQSPRQP